MKKIRLSDSQRFQTYIEEKISRESMFFYEYEMAVNSLNNIWKIQKNNKKNAYYATEEPNNIIAFCGERGSGKSSSMLSFIKALDTSYFNNDELQFSDELRKNDWKSRILIDPSVFDGVHNILDVVLAHIYQKFYETYKKDNQYIEQYEREKMLGQLSKVYRNLSIIKDNRKALDEEFDEAGNITKLEKLGESIKLKRELEILIDLYLSFMSKPDSERKCEKLLIVIDDLDLCNGNVYEMSEQIRKYLVINNVIIIMAIKIDQLEFGIEERTRGNFVNVLTQDQNTEYINNEIRSMAKHYTTKLIPKARRIYLPNLKSDEISLDTGLEKDNDNGKSIEHKVIDMIYQKTGILFIPSSDGYSYLIPVLLRDFIDLVSFLEEMENPGDNLEIKKWNISAFKSFFIEGMIKKNLQRHVWKGLAEIIEGSENLVNHSLSKFLDEPFAKDGGIMAGYFNPIWIYPSGSLASIIEIIFKRLDYLTRKEDTTLTHYMIIYYTILLNEKFIKDVSISEPLIRYFIWGNTLNYVIPAIQSENRQILMNREGFYINLLECWNAIAEELNDKYEFSLEIKDVLKDKVSKLKKDGRLSEIAVWCLLSLFGSSFLFGNDGKRYVFRAPFISGNYQIPPNIMISLENYIVSLCEVRKIYEIASFELLGVSIDEMEAVFEAFETENSALIEQAKIITVNVDLAMNLINYCKSNNDYKQATDTEEDRTYYLIKGFFNNVGRFLEKAGLEKVDWTQIWIPQRQSDDRKIHGVRIDICRIYSHICTVEADLLRTPNIDLSKALTGQELKQRFAQKVSAIAAEDYSGNIRKISGTIQQKNKNVKYTKDLLENIANAIQKYTFKEKRMPTGFEPNSIIKLYSEIIDQYLNNPESALTDLQYALYKTIAEIKNEIQ